MAWGATRPPDPLARRSGALDPLPLMSCPASLTVGGPPLGRWAPSLDMRAVQGWEVESLAEPGAVLAVEKATWSGADARWLRSGGSEEECVAVQPDWGPARANESSWRRVS
ncbi:hypothetical protein Sros01_72580 [Streptomyces roseochromogenus]|nr:hypothetical protein Sros01_72580 [Streptomyces roseochromogenus]